MSTFIIIKTKGERTYVFLPVTGHLSSFEMSLDYVEGAGRRRRNI